MIKTEATTVPRPKMKELIKQAADEHQKTVSIIFEYHADRNDIATDTNIFRIPAEKILDRVAKQKPISHHWCENLKEKQEEA